MAVSRKLSVLGKKLYLQQECREHKRDTGTQSSTTLGMIHQITVCGVQDSFREYS